MCDRCDPIRPSRRDLLRFGAAATASAALLGGAPLRRALAEDAPASVLPGKGTAKQVVYLFMNGGASQMETFDPKPGTTNGGPTKAIPTAVPGVHIASSLPQIAKRMDRIALIRGMSTKEGNHERARYLMHTGYPPTPTVVHAGIGSILSHEVGNREAALPNYIAINGPGSRPGYLGVSYAPFSVRIRGEEVTRQGANNGNQRRRRGQGSNEATVENLKAPRGISTERRDRRIDMLNALNEGFAAKHGDSVATAQAAMFDRARRLMDSPKNSAFDIGSESADTLARYGKSSFGKGCLMARRLLDEGVTCVEVNSGGWDTHDDGFNRVTALNGHIDAGISALLDDLRANGKLDETLIVWVGDFGRTPRIAATDGRGHFPRAWSTFFAGAGVQGGRVIGKTSNDGNEVVDGMVTAEDFFATIAHATGMDPAKTFHANGRPITIVEEKGRPVRGVFQA